MQPRNARDAGDSPAKPVVVVMVDGCGSPLAGSAHHDGRADGIGVDEEAEHENAGEGPGDGKNACGCMREMEKIMRPASPRLAATFAVLLLRSGLESRGSKHGSVISVERLVRKCRCRGVNRKLKLRRSAQESA